MNCVICFESSSFKNELYLYNHCGKFYIHKYCFSNWLKYNSSCFVCRIPFIIKPANSIYFLTLIIFYYIYLLCFFKSFLFFIIIIIIYFYYYNK